MEFVNQQFPSNGPERMSGPGGQKVVCTPEVSLYQYNGEGGIVADKGPLPLLTLPQPEGGEREGGSTSSTSGFQCGFCGKTFQQKNTFQNHLRSHREGEDPYQCDICGKTFAVPARLTRHYRTHTGEKPYQCEYCNKSFSVKENLSVHRRIHTKERPYKCEVCERAFEHSGKLHRHMRIHTGERPHRCQICQKTFIQSGQLVIHMRTHTGEKPYVCKVCNKGFTCSKQLKVHTRTHTGEKPYTCDICGKSFGYNHVLKLHQVAHYGEKVYKCTLCNGTFTSKKSLEAHIKTHSEGAVPVDPPSPSNIEPSIPSPSSLSQTPQNSDKENRESSDSEISSHSSPHSDSPKTPPSPPVLHHGFRPHLATPTGRGGYGKEGKNPTGSSSLPYPMLPPGVQVHQSPQSRTTFLYVTSKLPTPIQSGPDSPPPPNQPAPRNFTQLATTKPNISPPIGGFKGFGDLLNGNGGKTVDAVAQRDKMFLANMRDKKVLPFLEQFGYGLPKETAAEPFLPGRPQGDSNNLVTLHPIPGNNVCLKSEYGRPSPPLELNSRSPMEDHSSGPSTYTPGGVLALALTRGSKAVMQSPQFNPALRQLSSSPARSSESPDLGIDYSSRGSSSPTRNSLASLTPNSTPGSTPGPSDHMDEFTDSGDGHPPMRGEQMEMNNNEVVNKPGGGCKRRTSSGGAGCGPRKRSSLILEKYAQENPDTPSPPSPDSILSQRLRLSSVIQYAEKCS